MMIKKLLRLAAAMGTARGAELAQLLDVTPAIVQQMLETLEQEGYLNSVVQGCSVPCERCPLHPACRFTNRPRIWVLTKKGERLLVTPSEATTRRA